MCHHYKSAKNLPEHFVEEYHFRADQRLLFDQIADELKENDAWPLKNVPAVRIDDDGELAVFAAEWGLLPRWWKPTDKAPKRNAFQRKTFNARCETAHEKPTFRDAMKKRRCLLPVAEFFERGHYFGLGEPMAFAGLWELWLGAESEIATATLLTTQPNAEVRGVGHDRMPVLLTTPRERRQWLESGASGPDDSLLQPLKDKRLSVKPTA